eukprot:SAG31_NODE_7409_length_1696_cov_1.757671_3_plen_23_part_01
MDLELELEFCERDTRALTAGDVA